MKILGIITKRMKRGKDPKGQQRWHNVDYAQLECPICSKVFTLSLRNQDLNNIDDTCLCNSCNKRNKDILTNPNYFKDKIIELYGTNYNVIAKPYTKHKEKVTMVCKKHNTVIESRVADLLYAPVRYSIENIIGPCPTCRKMQSVCFTTTKNLEGYRLYYVYFERFKMFKLGLSSQDKLYNRFYSEPYKLLWEYPVSYNIGRQLKKHIHTEFMEYRYCGDTKYLKDGNPELYVLNIFPTLTSFTNYLNKSDLLKKFNI